MKRPTILRNGGLVLVAALLFLVAGCAAQKHEMAPKAAPTPDVPHGCSPVTTPCE
jgi:hypothetical protein